MQRIMRGFAACALLFLAGCGAQSQVTDLKNDTIHLRAQMQVLQDRAATRADVDSLIRYIGRLEQIVKEQTDIIWSMRADLSQQISTIDERQQVLDAKISESGRQFSNLSQKVEGVKARLTPSSADTAGKVADQEAMYNAALADYQRGNYELAIRQFTQFLQYYQGSDLADDAQYWIGDCFYNQKQYNQAVGAFEQLLIGSPRSNKAPAALLRIAFARLGLNDAKNARTYLERVIAEYPNAEEASLARMRLETLPKSK